MEIFCKTAHAVKVHSVCPKDNAFATTTKLALSYKEPSLESRPKAITCAHSHAHVLAKVSSGRLNQTAEQNLFSSLY
jgi:hypothetical protein